MSCAMTFVEVVMTLKWTITKQLGKLEGTGVEET